MAHAPFQGGRAVSRGGGVRVVRAFPGAPPAIAEAREFTAAFLAEAGQRDERILPLRCGDAVLVVSELVTNAVRHAPGPCRLTLELTGLELAITVADTSTRPPQPEPFEPQRIGQHGLEIVIAVCGSLDTRPTPEGKAVHAVMSLA